MCKLPYTNFRYRLVSSYQVYVLRVNFFFYRVLSCATFILVYCCQWHRPLPVICNKVFVASLVCCVSLYATIVLA